MLKKRLLLGLKEFYQGGSQFVEPLEILKLKLRKEEAILMLLLPSQKLNLLGLQMSMTLLLLQVRTSIEINIFVGDGIFDKLSN